MKKSAFALLSFLLVGVALWWWTQTHTEEDTPSYKTAAVSRGDVRSKVTATGTLQAVTQILVGSQVSGNIDQVFVGYNSAVKKGQILAQLDPSTYQTQVNQAQASVSNAMATLDNARGDLGNASANVKSAEAAIVGARAKVQQSQAGVLTARSGIISAQARLNKAISNRTNAFSTFERTQELHDRELISLSDLDTARTAYQGAQADVDGAQADLASAQASFTASQTVVAASQSEVDVARIKMGASQELLAGAYSRIKGFQAQVAQSEANLESARINLQRTTISSPIDGIVLDIAVTAGQTVAAQFQAPNLFTLAKNLDQMQVETSVDEADIGRVRVGARASFTVDAFPEEKFQGEVVEVRQAPVLTSNVVTYTVIVAAGNPKLQLKPGMTATVEVYDQERVDVVLINAEALRFQPPKAQKDTPGSSKVYTLEKGVLVPHDVQAGVTDGVVTEVVTSDLQVEDELVIEDTSAFKPAASSSRGGNSRIRMF